MVRRRHALLVLAGLLAVAACGRRAPSPRPAGIRVLTNTVYIGNTDLPATAALIRTIGADIVALQETTPALAAVLRAELAADYPYMDFHVGPQANGPGVLARTPPSDARYIPSQTGMNGFTAPTYQFLGLGFHIDHILVPAGVTCTAPTVLAKGPSTTSRSPRPSPGPRADSPDPAAPSSWPLRWPVQLGDFSRLRGGRLLATPAAMRRILCVLVIAAAACVEAPGEAADVIGGDGKDDRGGSAGFVEVDPSHSSATFRNYIEYAIRMLERDDSEIARLTARSIRTGRVKIDELVDLTCWDFERVRAEVPALGLTPADYARLQSANSTVARALTAELDGYMWSNRIYVSRGQPTRRLAATLVHEVNHVINRSEVGYWDDLPSSAFLHEYRAFHAEAMFDPEAYDGVDLVDHVIELYELDRDAMSADVLDAPLTPRLLPDDAAWRARRVAADPPDDESTCPGA